MQTLAIAVVPNQTFSTTLDDNRYDFAIYSADGVMCCDVTINEVPTILGQRITNSQPLIPANGQQGGGNFFLLTSNFDLPDYTQFGLTQTLIYISAAEIAAAAASAVPYVAPFVPFALA